MKIKIIGDSFTVTSDLKKADVQLLAKVNPNVLKVKDDNGNDLFKVAYTEGCPSITNYGISFSGTLRDNSDKLTLTMELSPNLSAEDAKEYVAGVIGKIVGFVTKLEESIPQVANQARSEKQAIINSIEVE